MTSLAGREILDQSPDQMVLNAELLYNINMGYATPKKLRPGDTALYHKSECEFKHPWSIESIGETYAFHKLQEYISIKDYLEMPSFLVDKLLEGMSAGRAKRKEEDDRRRKAEAERRKQNPGRGTSAGQDPTQMDAMTAEALAGMDLSQLGNL